MIFSIIIIIVFTILSFLFSGCETGLISINKLSLEKRARTDPKSKQLLDFVSNPDKVLGTTLIGTNISLVIVASVFTALVLEYKKIGLSETGSTLLISGILLIFAEIIPKTLFRDHSEYLIPKLLPFLNFFNTLFYPLIKALSKVNYLLLGILGVKHTKKTLFTREDLAFLISEAEKEGEVDKSEQEMIDEVLTFRELTVKNVMTPRTDIVAVQENDTIQSVINLSKKEGLTRFPVYSKDIDHIEGVLIIYDLLKAESSDEKVAKYKREVHFVPESMSASILLKKMQGEKTPLLIVVDEYGGTAGLITIEDLLEELVGEIEDEYDEAEIEVQKIDENTYMVLGEVEIDHLNDDYNLLLPKTDEYETIAGLIINQIARIPKKNEKFIVDGYELTVKQATPKKIEKVLIKVLPTSEITNPTSS